MQKSAQGRENKGDSAYGIGDGVGERTAESSGMGIVGTHPAVCVRVANTGLTGHGK